MFPGLIELRVLSPKQGNLNVRERSLYSGSDVISPQCISKLAMTQNLILRSFSDRIHSEESVVKLPELNFKVIKEKEFKNLIEKLDQVISPRSVLSEILVFEGVSHEFSVEAEGVQNFKIECKGRRCPLSIKIKSLFGNFQSVASLHELKAHSKVTYKSTKSHFHEIYDKTNEFRNEFCYISVKAISNSSFKIISEFGKHKFLSEYKRFEKDKNNLSFSDSDNEIQDHKKLNEKNFIRVNMEIKTLKNEDFSCRAEIREHKRQEILHRKKQNVKAKKKKIIDTLSKRIKRLEEEAMSQERITQRARLLTFCQDWLGIIYKIKSITHIHNLIKFKREDFFQKIKTSQKVNLIQKYYKTQLQPRTNPKITAVDTLLLYHSLTKIFQIKSIQKNTCELISTVAHTNLLFHMFTSFVEKIILLQRAYRRFCKRRNFRMSNLRIQWSKCMEKSLFTKKGNVRMRESLKFISIPANVRDKVLKEFYSERWKEFRKEVERYRKVEGGVGAFVKLPGFRYVPSDVIMEGMIRNVISRFRG